MNALGGCDEEAEEREAEAEGVDKKEAEVE